MAKAFLSYSSKDKKLVEKIAKQLGRNNCHLDSLTFEAGEITLDEIIKSLNDTDVFVLFISENSLQSDWVKKEFTNAKKLSDKKIIGRIFPLIIDKNITHSDSRIPDWIKKPYNIRSFDNEVLILKKIRQFLRESDFKKYSHLKELDELFVGRNDIIQDFERKIINIDNTKPTCIVASCYFEGIGRRTFLKNGLIKTRIIDKWREPVYIPIDSKESIEDFIYKLNFIQTSPEIFTHDFSIEDMDFKIKLAKESVKKFVDSGEILFIIDNGSIILPNHSIVDWFKKLISAPELENQISICLISKFKPHEFMDKMGSKLLSFQVNELTPPDTQTFFIQYLNLIGRKLSTEDLKHFLKYLKGIPGQIKYAANLIVSLGVFDAKNYVHDIEEFDELQSLSIFEFLKDDDFSKQLLITLSKLPAIISYDLIYKIFGESEQVNKSIQKLQDLSLFYPVNSTHEYLKLNTSIADYINRSKIELNFDIKERIKVIAKEAIEKPLELNEYTDYSEFLFSLQTMIRNRMHIPQKFLIPSFILKSMILEYYNWHFKTVIELAIKILENESKFDYQIIRETRYWLCLAYCRTKNDKFFEEIKYFKDSQKDYYFLIGFYYRNSDKMELAEENFLKVLDYDRNHSRTKRELVNVYLRKGEYMKALNWANDNYVEFKTNILHIQAYFTCLIKKEKLNHEDHETILELLESSKKSLNKKAVDIYNEMQAEYDYYVNRNSNRAIKTLKESLNMNPNNYFACRALIEIYKRDNKLSEIESLKLKYPDLTEYEFE